MASAEQLWQLAWLCVCVNLHDCTAWAKSLYRLLPGLSAERVDALERAGQVHVIPHLMLLLSLTLGAVRASMSFPNCLLNPAL